MNDALTAGMKPLIDFCDVSKIYKVGDEQVHALDKANITIRRGEFVSIVGPSGSGKSTMMNIIGCLDIADEGEYLLEGVSTSKHSPTELANIRNTKIGFIFQGFNLIAKMSAEENIELPLIYQRLPIKERKIRVGEALERVGLTDRRAHKPSELSGGQQQRVAIARAIVTKPSLILADEPTGNLDSKTGAEILSIFLDLNAQGNTVVLITHDNDIASQAKRKITMLDGRAEEAAV